ncbi:MAG TPA: D-amino acid dehydrogenase [Gammaproteobacteria bacterium]|nr:D-amino acid dehydrogenase [Gammaproteobacteria bacterium]
MNAKSPRSTLVIGGGIIGVTTAWYLAERGVAVTLLERREAAALETSYANGGLVTPSQSDPWNGPGTVTHLIKWFGREDSPLLLRMRALPGMWRWGLRFLLASRAGPWWHATEANLRLGLYSADCLTMLRERLRLEYDSLNAGTLKVFRDGYAFERSVALAEALSAQGLSHRALGPADAARLEPLLEPVQGQLAGAIHYPKDASGDAQAFTRQLERKARGAGVEFRYGTEVTGLRRDSKRIGAVITPGGELEAESYVLAAGNASPALLATVGLPLPMYPVKGYSITVPAAEWTQLLGVPLVDFEHKTVLTPLGARLRIAGTAEFNGFDTSLNPRRGASILRRALALVPALAAQVDVARVEHWAGLRPMTADGPPVLGATPLQNLFLNTGHGPLGWTLAAGSGRVVADLVVGRRPEIDLKGLDYGRYTR